MQELNDHKKIIRKLSKTLKQKRLEKGLTIRKVADFCGVDENNYSRFEKGGNINPTVKTLVKICNALEVDLFEFLKDVERAK